MAFPEAWLNELMNRNDIVSVVSEYTRLSPKGGRLWGLCPFHPERDASFTVSPDKQVFHCFSCKAGGSVIQFIMQAESLGYADAVRFLAQRAGMDMPNEINDAKLRAEKALRDRLYAANRDAAMFYHKTLLSDAGLAARQYLLNRGIDGSTAVRFGLGYSPNDWDELFKHMTALGYTRDELVSAGLCVKGRKDETKTFDFFHDRLMFPVISASGRVLAFGGRIIGSGDGAKYMNTGDTLIYNKRHNIYAINLMKGRRLDELIMVEGYMDVISLHQAGIDNAVASLGTALTSQQVRLMGRFAKRVCYAYDGDAAGQKAMLRGVDIIARGELEPRVIVIPGGQDPDEFVRANGAEAFLKLKDNSLTAVMFKLETMAGAVDLNTADGRQKYASEACRLLASLEPVERDRYIKVVSERSGIAPDVIRNQCGVDAEKADAVETAAPNRAAFDTVGYRKPQTLKKREKAEQLLLACMLVSRQDAAAIEQLESFSTELFSVPGAAKFAAALLEAYKSVEKPDVRLLLAELNGDESDAVGAAAALSEDITAPVEAAADCINSILSDEYSERIRKLAELSEAETDRAKRSALLHEQMQLMLRLKQLRPSGS